MTGAPLHRGDDIRTTDGEREAQVARELERIQALGLVERAPEETVVARWVEKVEAFQVVLCQAGARAMAERRVLDVLGGQRILAHRLWAHLHRGAQVEVGIRVRVIKPKDVPHLVRNGGFEVIAVPARQEDHEVERWRRDEEKEREEKCKKGHPRQEKEECVAALAEDLPGVGCAVPAFFSRVQGLLETGDQDDAHEEHHVPAGVIQRVEVVAEGGVQIPADAGADSHLRAGEPLPLRQLHARRERGHDRWFPAAAKLLILHEGCEIGHVQAAEVAGLGVGALGGFTFCPLGPACLGHILKVDALVVDGPRVEGAQDCLPQPVAAQEADPECPLALLGEARLHLLAKKRVNGERDPSSQPLVAVRVGRQAPQACVLDQLEIFAQRTVRFPLRPQPRCRRGSSVAILGQARILRDGEQCAPAAAAAAGSITTVVGSKARTQGRVAYH
eukprot:scaffold616_cov120-Isochrysis_galbana.AAC.5